MPDHSPRRSSAARASAGALSGEPAAPVLPLYTPAAAAELLAVRESWLRRRAAARAVPCTFLGKHLRFSHADVHAIVTAAARPATAPPSSPAPAATEPPIPMPRSRQRAPLRRRG